MRTAGDEEEPQRETPEPETDEVGADECDVADHGAEAGTHEVAVGRGGEDRGQGLAHVDYTGYGEAGRTDGDEHARAEGFFGEFLRHEAVDEGGVDHFI